MPDEFSNLLPPTTYQGAKGRLADAIVDIMFPNIDIELPQGRFYDLCCGSGAVALTMRRRGLSPKKMTMIDAGPWGMFWERVGYGWFFLDKFRTYCNAVPKNPAHIYDHIKELSESPVNRDAPYVFLLLQASSFGGKAIWIDDGKWQNTTFRRYWTPTETSNRRSPVNPMMPMPKTLYDRTAAVCEHMQGVRGLHMNAELASIDKDGVVYIDPPYDSTTSYGHDLELMKLIEKAKKSASAVYVSEGSPLSDNATCLSSGRKKGGISGERKKDPNEEWLSRVS